MSTPLDYIEKHCGKLYEEIVAKDHLFRLLKSVSSSEATQILANHFKYPLKESEGRYNPQIWEDINAWLLNEGSQVTP